jgi:DNA-binding MarR family transcriptional regulator
MRELILKFINTLELSMKKHQLEMGNISGFSKLTISQLQYIEAVSLLNQPTITEISEHLHVSKASVTTGVTKLVNLGYLEKKQSATDKREIHVSMTDKATSIIQAKQKVLQKYEEVILSTLDEQESLSFQIALNKIINGFNQEQ